MKLTAMKFLKLAALQSTALAAVVTATPALA